MALDVQVSLDFGGVRRLLSLPAPGSPNEPARLADLNAAVEGLAWKDSVRVAAGTNITISAPGATIDGITMAVNDRMLLRSQTAGPENGIYIFNGPATPATRSLDASTSDELEQAVVTVEEGTSAASTFRQTLVNFVLGTGTPTFVSFGTTAPAASESTAGILELATQPETDGGADDLRAITALKLKNSPFSAKRYGTAVGDGTSTNIAVTHNLNSREVVVEVFRNSGNYDTVLVEVRRTSVNVITLVFDTAPAANSFYCAVKY